MLSKVLNIVFFQIGWFACVLGAAHGYPWVGPLMAVPIVGFYLWQEADRQKALRVVLFVGCLGTVLDSVLSYAGILLFRDSLTVAWVCPPWLAALWAMFATTLRSSLAWLAERMGLAALLGGIVGPVSYYAGSALGALDLGLDRVGALTVLCILWAGILPLSVRWVADEKAVTSARRSV
jgi:hypothetical protein